MFQNPVLITNRIATQLDVSVQSALNHIRRLETEGIVREVASVPGRSKRWVAPDVFTVLDPDARIESGPSGP